MSNQKSKAAIRWNKSLRIRLSILLVLAPLTLAIVMIFVSLGLFHNRILDENASKAEMLARILAESIDGDSIDRYLDTLEKDDEYENVLEFMRILQNNPEILYVYVVRVVDGGMLFVFDADEDEETLVELGYYEQWFGSGSNISYEEFLEHQSSLKPLRDISYSEWGWILTVFHPIQRSDGSITAFVCVDISMDSIMYERQILTGLLSFIILIFFIVTILINIFAIQGWIFKPIGKLVELVTGFRKVISSSEELPELQTERGKYSDNELVILQSALIAMKEHIVKGFDEKAKALASITESQSFSSGDLKAASDLIAKTACETLNASRVGIWSTDNDSMLLKCITYYDLATKSHTVQDDISLSGCDEYMDLLKTERLIIINDARIKNPLTPVFEKYYGPDIRATLDAPIRAGGKPVGVVCIEQDATSEYSEGREWNIEEQNFASSLADFTALAIESNDRHALAHRTELLLNSLPGLVYQTKSNPPDFTPFFISEGCFALTGYTREEIIGDEPIRFFDIVYPEDLPALQKLMEETLFIGMPLDTTYRIITKYGAVKWIWDRSHVTDYDDEGNPRILEGFYTDITEQRRLEAAEAASHAKSEFLSNMSHEMRTPLNAIVGMTAIGKRTKDIEGKTHALNKIGDASSHLLGMVNDILDMAKIEANKLELLSSEFHFNNMVEKVLTMIRFRADEKQQTLTVNTDNKIPMYLIGDDQRLSQVLINILWNAVKFTQIGGSIHMEISLSEKHTSSCELKAEITDDGIGISAEQQAKLFGVFEQADSKTGRAYGGTGLGLPIAKRIVEMMDGRIWVDSELGKGARFNFTVTLGISKREDKEQDSTGETANEGIFNIKTGIFEGKNMLVAEDVEINREILLALLEDTGINIDCAENGKEAVDMISSDREKYDIVLMDLQMPHMGGLEATRIIRSMQPRNKSKLPIVAMTANVFKEDIDACFDAGMNDHMGKPLDIDKLMEKLTKYLL